MINSSPRSRKLTRWVLAPFEGVVVAVVNTTLLFRLGNMQLDGLPAAIGGMLALLAAITSLMFNRARAYPSGPVQRRSLLAAELGLRATLLVAFGAVLVAVIFPFLQASGFAPTPADKWPTQALPIVFSLFPMLFFLLGSLELLKVARVLTPTLSMYLRARHIKYATRP